MKIAIQGHPTRGKEVIQILKDLGGKGSLSNFGYNEKMYYWINSNNIILESLINIKTKKEVILYTLEEFENEFPFKIGDKVIHKEYDNPFEIIEFDPENVYPYAIDGLCEFRTKSCTLIKYQPKMKEERNITLTLDKAKEWYNKGEELREIALQAFSEKELTKVDLPKTWEEFCNNYSTKNGECYIGACSEMHILPEFDEGRDVEMDRNVCPSQKSAEAHLAMIQLEQLRDCWRQGSIPQGLKFKIRKVRNKYTVLYGEEDAFLSFCDKQTAEEFLKCFKDLIEQAGDLI